MTFDELNAKYGKLTRSDWTQNPGGGWVHRTARIGAGVIIGAEAVVWGGTIMGGTIMGGTIEGGTIWGGTIMGGKIRGGTIWGGTIEDGTWKAQPLFICGSSYPLTNSKPGHVTVGCQTHSFAWWEKHGLALAKVHHLSTAQISEYRAYFQLFFKIGR